MGQSSQQSGEREQTAPPPHKFAKLRAVRNLVDEKIPEKQAMAIVETIEDARSGFATQAGMEKMEVALRSDMEKMETSLRSDMEKMETSLRSDMKRMIDSLRSEMRHDMEKLELRMRADMESLRADVQAEFKRLYWFIPLVMGVVVGILKIT
ncbi:MAG: hypothetical protein OXN23_00215 [Gammaproteobacteria bacterium]|nr:hypothetical protein [Gammaproteobacteria bacterium]MDE0611934.1 hypothetical protein [Gammaproteobacteria bacterium]